MVDFFICLLTTILPSSKIGTIVSAKIITTINSINLNEWRPNAVCKIGIVKIENNKKSSHAIAILSHLLVNIP